MIYVMDADIPHDFEQYQPKTRQEQYEVPFAVCLISELEMAYAFTCIRVSGFLPCAEILKQTGTHYSYQPDQRPYTLRELGKPSSGPSPPLVKRYRF